MSSDPNTMPIRYDIEAYRGGDLTRMFQVVYVDSGNVTHTLDTTGWTAEMQVRTKRSAASADLTLSTTSGEMTTGIQTDGVNEWCLMVHVPGDDLDADLWDGYTGVYDIKMTDGSGREVPFYTGRFSVEGNVTR